MTFVLKRADVLAAGGYCALLSMLDHPSGDGFVDQDGNIVYPNGFTVEIALEIYDKNPEALFWLERRQLVPCLELTSERMREPDGPRAQVIAEYFAEGTSRLQRYLAKKAARPKPQEGPPLEDIFL